MKIFKVFYLQNAQHRGTSPLWSDFFWGKYNLKLITNVCSNFLLETNLKPTLSNYLSVGFCVVHSPAYKVQKCVFHVWDFLVILEHKNRLHVNVFDRFCLV